MKKIAFLFCIFFCFLRGHTKPSSLQIFGGTNATLGQFPYAVQLLEGDESNLLQACGGSLISEEWVLTAAHCVDISKWIGYGTINRWKWDMPAGPKLSVKIEKAIQHPHYSYTFSPINGTWNITNDVALLKLSTPISYSNITQPVKLAELDDPYPENESATLVGWGLIDILTNDAIALQSVNITVYGKEFCENWFKNLEPKGTWPWRNQQNICAGDVEYLKKGGCSKDSGGPLTVNGVQIGIVSWSQKPCISGPGVFTKISVYRDWIKQVSGV